MVGFDVSGKYPALLTAAFIVLMTSACQTDNIRPGSVMRHYYSACAGAWIARSDIDKLAVAHCAKYDRKAVFDYVKRSAVCGPKKFSTDAFDAYFGYKCED